MDSKYIIGIVVILLVALGAYEVYAHETSDKTIIIAGSTSVQPVAENWLRLTWQNTPALK